MSSFVWWRDIQEAYENPYEYEAQNQFSREAKKLLELIFDLLLNLPFEFTRDDRSSEKAIWMLSIDAVDSLRDCLKLIDNKEHRLASRLFRDVVETMDLASYFSSDDEKKQKHLDDWYDNKVIPNRIFREYVEKTHNKQLADAYNNFYRHLSKLNHRTYRSLAYSYTLGKGERMVYEGKNPGDLLVPVQSISMYYAMLAELITIFSDRLIEYDLLDLQTNIEFWNRALEKNTVSRRFATKEEIFLQRLKNAKINQEVDDIT